MRILVTREPGVELPAYATEGAAGLDVRANEDFSLAPGERRAVATGLRVALPPGWELQVRPRSGLALRHGVTVANAPGTVDEDFRGELRVLLVNLGADVVQFSRGDRVAQLVPAPVPRVEWVETDELPPTARGEGGFGSTGRAQGNPT